MQETFRGKKIYLFIVRRYGWNIFKNENTIIAKIINKLTFIITGFGNKNIAQK